jgi:hypothetical protein
MKLKIGPETKKSERFEQLKLSLQPPKQKKARIKKVRDTLGSLFHKSSCPVEFAMIAAVE